MHDTAPAPSILLVENDRDHTELLRRALLELSPDTRLTALSDGEAALDYLFRRGAWADSGSSPEPQLVLLDLRLPGLDGFAVLRQIKAEPRLRHIPVVILTSSSAEQDVQRAYAEHANSYLVKPFEYERKLQLLARTHDYWLARNRRPLR
jgi:CheY-like chemotaxis protein